MYSIFLFFFFKLFKIWVYSKSQFKNWGERGWGGIKKLRRKGLAVEVEVLGFSSVIK